MILVRQEDRVNRQCWILQRVQLTGQCRGIFFHRMPNLAGRDAFLPEANVHRQGSPGMRMQATIRALYQGPIAIPENRTHQDASTSFHRVSRRSVDAFLPRRWEQRQSVCSLGRKGTKSRKRLARRHPMIGFRSRMPRRVYRQEPGSLYESMLIGSSPQGVAGRVIPKNTYARFPPPMPDSQVHKGV